MTGDRSQLTKFVNKFLGTVKFGNDHVAKTMGYDDYKIRNVIISRVNFMEGLGHNLFFVGQFCDSNLEVAFRQHTCIIRNLEGVDLLTSSRGNNLYTLSLGDMMASSPICLLSKASKTKSWLWHRHLSHLNFGAINHLARQSLVRESHKPKSEDTNQEKLYLLHMDLCGPMRVESVNEKKYILVIVNDYSRFTWVKCLRSKDEAPYFIIKFLKMIQARLMVPVRHIRIDNETEFVNQTLREYYEQESYSQRLILGSSLVMHQQNKAFRIYNRRTRKIVETIHVDFDELTTMASEQSSLGPALHEMIPATISSGLVPKPTSSTTFVPPSRNEWDLLFQPLFDELLTPSPTESTGSPSLTTIDQDAPSPSKSQTTSKTQPPVIPNDVEEGNHDIEVAHMGNDPLFGMPIPEVVSDQSSLMDSSIALKAFADVDHAGCQDTHRSTSGSLQFLGDRLISWSSKRQKSAAISSTEAEYIALSKHIDIRYHFIKEHVENGVIKLYFFNMEYQLVDLFTKALGRERIEFLINKLGMRSFTPETLKQLTDEVDE
uniref:Retrovirus-related Pol polyprotein from transposon TNT 1-94 n=1 Tax=Tanacetum cinerariifolium TaxID=118510 RepID=A0A699IHR1_TANCI|nr:retrovirus-related Pol polyprotein from transposon TNT 1-94 [Tanacetum cinerariifolium]